MRNGEKRERPAGVDELIDIAIEIEKELEVISRAVALQGAYMAVLQRVLVRLAASQANAGTAEAVAKAMRDGAQQLQTEAERLAAAGYQDVLEAMVNRFDGLRADLKQQAEGADPEFED